MIHIDLMSNTNALTPPKHDFYVSLQEVDGVVHFAIESTLEKSKKKVASNVKGEKNSRKTNSTDDAKNDSSEIDIKFKKILDSINRSMEGYHELISMSGAIAKAVTGPLTVHKIRKFAKDKLDIVDVDGEVKTYGVDGRNSHEFFELIGSNARVVAGFSFLPPAILMGAVAFFDAALSDIIKAYLVLNPQRYQNSEKTYAASQLIKIGSLDNLIGVMASEEVDSLMRGSHSDQVKFIDKNFSLTIKNDFKKWGQFIEIFERRNIITHANGIVNDIYISNCKSVGLEKMPKIGDQVRLTKAYLIYSINILHEMILRILFELWNKKSRDKKEILYYSYAVLYSIF